MSARPDIKPASAVTVIRPSGTPEDQKRLRAEALLAAEVMWKNRNDIPLDGVAYQELIRSE
ncbi:hypothetical protein [Janthinobacterium sp. RB2R34]|uniref:hypothetical protein n=1 Tax=Janthinobacterium sp. RB2R34 TaxID=3424193 RepID=UPI003F28FB59